MKRSLFVVLVMTMITTAWPSSDPQIQIVSAGNWLSYLNAIRAKANLSPVTENPWFSWGCYQHAKYMVKVAYSHDEDPSRPYYTPEGAAAGRSSNIWISYSANETDEAAFDAWMQSPPHAAGILRPELAEVGYAAYREAGGQIQAGFCLDVIRGLRQPLTEAQVHALYQATFCRNADPSGLSSFAGSRLSEAELRQILMDSPEGQRVAMIRKAYLEILGRDPIPAGCPGLQQYYQSGMTEAQIRQSLAAGQNPATPSPPGNAEVAAYAPPYENALVIGLNPQRWLLQGGKRRLVPDDETFNALYSGIAQKRYFQFGADLERIPRGDDVPCGARCEMIKRAYQDLLGREPDPAGLQSWFNSGLNDDQIRSLICGSPEGRAHGCPSAGGPNLIPNPSFELASADLLGWRTASPTWASQGWAGGTAHTGNRSLRISGPTTSPQGTPYAVSWETTNQLSFDPAKRYSLTVWAKAGANYRPEKGGWNIVVAGYGSDSVLNGTALSSEWQQFTSEIQVPNSLMNGTVRINYFSSDASDQNTTYFDDISLVQLP